MFINHQLFLFSGHKNKNMRGYYYAIIIIKNKDILEWKFIHPISYESLF